MPNLAGFAAFAERVGKLRPARENSVPFVPQPGEHWGTPRGTDERKRKQSLSDHVPHVPLVPLDEEDLQVAFEERAAILEYDGGWPRPEAERLARIEVFGAK